MQDYAFCARFITIVSKDFCEPKVLLSFVNAKTIYKNISINKVIF